MKFIVVITDSSPQFGGEVHLVYCNRHDAIRNARRECLEARAIGIRCYAKILPAKRNGAVRKEFERLGWL